MLNKWNYLNECADGAHVISKIKSCYDDYEQELDRIEFEIQAYNNTSDEEWDMIVKEGNIMVQLSRQKSEIFIMN